MITIVGGGVSGVTCALTLRLLGYDVQLICKERSDAKDRHLKRYSNRRMASLHGVASVLTHTVNSPNLVHWLGDSQELFGLLQAFATFGVRKQRHFEVFEDESLARIPDYAGKLHNFHNLPFTGQAIPEAPSRYDNVKLWGWSFDCFFVETGSYLPKLFELFQSLGGEVKNKELKKLSSLSSDIVINCTGADGGSIFTDPSPQVLYRGALVYVDAPLLMEKWTRQLTSYNYVMGNEYLNAHTKKPGDLYFYPRADGVVLGGTREEGLYHGDKWHGEYMDCKYVRVGTEEVPEPILSQNALIIERLTGVDIRKCSMQAAYGLRSTRKAGVRVEAEQVGGKTVIHNYGHGGSGVTLSLGCALEVARLASARSKLPKVLKVSTRELELIQQRIVELL